MKKALSLCLKYLSLFTVMGSIYYLIEIIWRGYSHVSMFILAGVYGGSLYYSAKELKRIGAKTIYAYATHTENSILDREKGTLIKSLEDNTVERLYTTGSLFAGEHEKITVLEV